jgi:hypothetical protein
MVSHDLKKCIDHVEACADEARRCMQSARVPAGLHDAVEFLHKRAREARTEASSVDDDNKLHGCVAQLEEAADRALHECEASTVVDPKMLQAVQTAHAEALKLKRHVEARSAA